MKSKKKSFEKKLMKSSFPTEKLVQIIKKLQSRLQLIIKIVLKMKKKWIIWIVF